MEKFDFVKTYSRSKNVLNHSFLQFLTLREILKLSMTCSKMADLIKDRNFKIVAAQQFLKDFDDLEHEEAIAKIDELILKDDPRLSYFKLLQPLQLPIKVEFPKFHHFKWFYSSAVKGWQSLERFTASQIVALS